MDIQAQDVLTLFEASILDKGFREIEVEKWDQIQERIVKSKIRIIISQDNQILYIQDGIILKKESIQHISSSQEISTNLDQIKYIQWLGEYGQNMKKRGKWIFTWNMEVLKDVGGYYDCGQKQGLWKEPIKNYWSKAQIYEKGVYLNNQKYGPWSFIQENKQIGGGQYNNQGQKNGKWIELSDRYYHLSQVTYIGEYKNGNKVGIWEFYLNYEKVQLIGCGVYYEIQEESLKTGMWSELSDGFSVGSQINSKGNYKQGKKMGLWNVYWIDNQIDKLMGGGLYDSSLKTGKWNELITNFGGGQGQSQIIYNGEFFNDKKVGRWNILYKEYWEKNFQNVGGGLYNDQGSIKIGNWIEVSENFGSKRGQSFVTYIGEYQNGKKVGQWNIWYKYYNAGWQQEQIGGGSYDEKGSFKIGTWIEVSDGFEMNLQVIYKGEYQNGEKAGRWDILYREFGEVKFKLIGGGSYGEGGLFKVGNWVELVEGSIVNYDIINGIKK